MIESFVTVANDDPLKGGPEIQRLRMANSVRAIVDWPLPPPNCDDALPRQSAAMLCRALLASGTLAFRIDKDDLPAGDRFEFFPEPASRQSWWCRTLNWFFDSYDESKATFGVVVTNELSVAHRIFIWGGWTYARQAVLVYDPLVADQTAVLDQLRHGLDWRNRHFLPGVKLLFGAGHDGGFGLIAAPDKTCLEKFTADLEDASGIEPSVAT